MAWFDKFGDGGAGGDYQPGTSLYESQNASAQSNTPTYGWVDQYGNAMQGQDLVGPILDVGSLIGNFWAQGYDALGRELENYNLEKQNNPDDYLGFNAELGYGFNPNPESVKKNQQKIYQNNDIVQAQQNAAQNMAGDFVSGKFKRDKDYSSEASKIAKSKPEEYVKGETEDKGQPSSSGDMEGKGQNRSSSEIWQDWYSGKGNPEAYANFSDFQFAGNNANDWLDFMLYADQVSPGMYSEILQTALGDSYGFDANDAAALAAAQAAYSNWYNPWVGSHTVSDILGGTAAGAEILGGYAADQDIMRDYLNSLNSYIVGDNVDQNYIGIDANGTLYDTRTNQVIPNYFALGSEESNMYLGSMLANLAAQNNSMTEDQYDLMSTMFDDGIDYGAYDNNVYTMAGADPYQEQLAAQLASANMMDPTLYMSNPEYARMAQQVFANRSNLGSNQTYTEDQWKAILGE